MDPKPFVTQMFPCDGTVFAYSKFLIFKNLWIPGNYIDRRDGNTNSLITTYRDLKTHITIMQM